MSENTKKSNAGRKKLPQKDKRVNFVVRVKPETRSTIASEAKLWGKSMGRVIDDWALSFLLQSVSTSI